LTRFRTDQQILAISIAVLTVFIFNVIFSYKAIFTFTLVDE